MLLCKQCSDSDPGKAGAQFRFLPSQSLYKGKEPNKMRLGICSRSGDILEPMITPQWYVNCDSMAKRATDSVRNGELKILPAEQEKTWFQWLDNIRDWCVSRQLWWGHQIPAWFATKRGEDVDKNDMTHNDRWIVARTEEVIVLPVYERVRTLSVRGLCRAIVSHFKMILVTRHRMLMKKPLNSLAAPVMRLPLSAMRTYSTRGSRRDCFRFRSWDGPIKPTI